MVNIDKNIEFTDDLINRATKLSMGNRILLCEYNIWKNIIPKELLFSLTLGSDSHLIYDKAKLKSKFGWQDGFLFALQSELIFPEEIDRDHIPMNLDYLLNQLKKYHIDDLSLFVTDSHYDAHYVFKVNQNEIKLILEQLEELEILYPKRFISNFYKNAIK